VLTVNGKAESIVQDAESYQRLLDRLQHMETLVASQEEWRARTRRVNIKDGVISDLKEDARPINRRRYRIHCSHGNYLPSDRTAMTGFDVAASMSWVVLARYSHRAPRQN
jgi:hypothetical protein